MEEIRTREVKLIILYVLATLIVFFAFWAGYKFFIWQMTPYIAGLTVFGFGSLYGMLYKQTWAAILFWLAMCFAIGSAMSILFAAKALAPTGFFALMMLSVIVYKALQTLLALTKAGKDYSAFIMIFMLLEAGASIWLGIKAGANSMMWQAFFALVLCFFYSCVRFVFSFEGTFFHQAALSFMMGFAFIFVMILTLLIGLVSESHDAHSFRGAWTVGYRRGKDDDYYY